MKLKNRKFATVLLFSTILLAGCSPSKKDTVVIPVVEISDSEKLPYNEWEDIPYADSLAAELQSVAADLNVAPIETITYLRYDKAKDEDETDICSLSFIYKEALAFGRFCLIEEKWCAMYIIDAKTAETYWASSEYEGEYPFTK